ncbi:MAG: beta-lactamase family protein, partial [Deltaproteobacteria bacterium]|nr:beta-lactamase family protein [Deltaproteobacteria bacterium]
MVRRSRKVHLDGNLHPDFQNVASILEGILERQKGGAALCIYHHGECVVDLWGGYLDSARTPWRRDTMAPSFSTTKGVTSTLMHIMSDRGLIDYDARVADYWPEFARRGKQDITIRQILTHQAGLYHIRHMIDDASRMCDWGYMIDAIERAEPIHEPGERTGYHGLTYGFLAGEVLQRVTGKRFSALVQSEIAEPLGLDGLFVGAPESELHRTAELIWSRPSRVIQRLGPKVIPPWLAEAGETATSLLSHSLGYMGIDLDLPSVMDGLVPRGLADFKFDADETLKAALPAANGLFTARSLARMYAALSQGGELDGVRLLSRRSLSLATERQPRVGGHSVLPIDMGWRLGYHAVPTSRGVPQRAFGHFGFGGSGAWADPSRELAVALTVNCGTGTPLGDLRIIRLGGAALST